MTKRPRQVYLDHSSACPLDPSVREAMEPFLSLNFASPASLSKAGREAKKAVEKARNMVARLVGAPPGAKVIFTSSACEANNLALFGYCRKNRRKGKHIIVSKVAHKSTLKVVSKLEEEGYLVSRLNVDDQGQISLKELRNELGPETLLLSLMVANDQVGTLQPLAGIKEVLSGYPSIKLHVDARASVGNSELNMDRQGLDLVSISSNDIYGPRGMGALVAKPRMRFEPHLLGTDQEFGLRAGGENVASIVGFGKAAQITLQRRKQDAKDHLALRDHFEKEVLEKVKGANVNGHPIQRAPHISHLRFEGVEAETLVLELERVGISTAAQSICLSKSLDPSHVLKAMGLSFEQAMSSVQFSFGRSTTMEDLEYVLNELPLAVERVLGMI